MIAGPRSKAVGAALLVMSVGLFNFGGSVKADPPTSGDDSTDWPAMISRLKQEIYRHPGLTQPRQQLAIAYNNYGVSLSEQGQLDLAARQFQEALQIDAASQQVRQNLANVYYRQAHEAYQQRQIHSAAETLDQAIVLNPNFVQAYILLGKIEYDQQKLKEAKAAWQRAIDLDPAQTEVAEQLKQVSDEIPVESKFERLSQSSFDLRYEEQVERPVGFDIRDALLEARRAVGSNFAYWPNYKIVVLIYSAESFRRLRQETPEWLAGQFDGKIRVPLPSDQLNQAAVKGILFHEYTHAVIHDLTNGNCPTWLNEGLAEYEGRTQFAPPLRLLTKAYQAQQLIPWSELSAHIAPTLSAEDVGLAYEQSYSLASYLVERYGFWKIRRLLKALASGASWETELAGETRMKLPKLEAAWQEQLAAFLQTPRS